MKQNLVFRHTGATLALVILFVSLFAGPVASGQDRPPSFPALSVVESWQPPLPPTAEPEGEGPWVVRAHYTDRQQVNALAAWTEPWEVHHDQGYLVVEVDREGYQWMLDAGFRLEIDARLTAQLQQFSQLPSGQINSIPGYACYRTVEETFATAQDIVANYPDLATWIDVGDSWEKTAPGGLPGYDMMVLRLTNANVPGPKPKLFVMTSVHAREYTPAELNTRFAEYLVNNYGVDADVTWLLDYHEMHLMLQANPDGRKHAETGLSWRKNTNENYCGPTSNYRGADLNRNFEFQWGCCGGSSGSQCAETYRGPSPASEPETQTIQNYVRSQFPDQRGPNLGDPAPQDATGVFLDIHSYSQLVLWPWGFTSSVAPNGTALQTLGRKLAYFNGYEPDQAIGLYATDGTTDDFAYGDLGVAAYVFELGTTFFQDCSSFENIILPDNLESLLYAAKSARTPYMTPAGPDALSVEAMPAGVAPGELVQLSTTLDDTRYNNQNGSEPTQNIVAAEYYIDVPPWITTTTPIPYPMTPSDGNFNQTIEDVEATVDTSGLSVGRHIIFVRGQDAGGNWGPVSAAFVYVLDPAVSPVIEGYVRDATTSVPLEAMVTAQTFQANTDPATGYYSMTVVSGTYEINAIAANYGISRVTGVEAQNYQSVWQDFALFPICDVFTDDVESGNPGWTAQGNWAITTEASHSTSHSWTDSPGGNYGNYWNYSLISPIFDFSDYGGLGLSFWHIHDLEDGYDYGYVEYSTDGGSSWDLAASYNGENQNTWIQEQVDLSGLDGAVNARIRFRLDTDTYVTEDGWHIDDIVIFGGGPGCGGEVLAPAAQFSSNSPVLLGQAIDFVNLSTGTLPIDYLWDFGDGIGTSTESDPSYTYLSAGTFTITLVATNSLGSDSVSHPVVVQPVQCVPLTEITIAGASSGYPGTYTFTTSYQPPTATTPISYTWDDGGTAAASVRNLGVGTHTLTVTATNCLTTSLSDSHLIQIQPVPVCTQVTGVDLSLITAGTLYTDTLVQFEADVAPDDATKPYTYTVDYGDGAVFTTTGSADPLTLSHTYAATGTYTVQIGAWNCDMVAPVTDAVTLTVHAPEVCVDLSGIDVVGPSSGQPGTYTFTTDYRPLDASPPISYTWDDGGTAATSVRELGVGVHSLTVTATNCLTASVTASHTIVVQSSPVCTPLTGVGLSLLTPGTLQLGTELSFSADLAPDDATKPYSYTISYGDGTVLLPASSSQDPLVFSYTYSAEGSYAIVVSVWNCDMSVPVSDTLAVEIVAESYRLYLPIVIKND